MKKTPSVMCNGIWRCEQMATVTIGRFHFCAECAVKRQEKKLAELDEKLGQMMARRANEEEKLADLYKRRAKVDAR